MGRECGGYASEHGMAHRVDSAAEQGCRCAVKDRRA